MVFIFEYCYFRIVIVIFLITNITNCAIKNGEDNYPEIVAIYCFETIRNVRNLTCKLSCNLGLVNVPYNQTPVRNDELKLMRN